LPFQQVSEEYLEVDQLRCLILVSARRLLQQPLKSIPRLDVILIRNGTSARLNCASRNLGSAVRACLKNRSASSYFCFSSSIAPRKLRTCAWFGSAVSACSANLAAESKSRCS